MEEGFDIHIKDNFLDKEIYKLIYDNIFSSRFTQVTVIYTRSITVLSRTDL